MKVRNKNRNSIYRVMAVFTASFVITNSLVVPARAGVIEVVLGGFLVKDIVKQFEQAGIRLMQEGANQGDALSTKVGNEIRVATRNLDYMFSEQQNQLFDNLTVQQQQPFIEMNKWITTINEASERTASIAELANLDLIEFTNRLKLVTQKQDYYISSVKGLTLVNQDNDFEIRMRGVGFGFDDSNRKYNISVQVDGQELPTNALYREANHELMLKVPNTFVKNILKDDKIVNLPIRFSSAITKRVDRPWPLKDKFVNNTYSTNFGLVLLPKIAGEVTVEEVVEEQELDGVTKTHAITVTTKGCTSKNPCDWDREWSCAENERITAVRYACTGQCGWSYNRRRGGYDPDYDILNGGKTVKVFRHVDGEESTTVTHYIDYQTLKKTYKPKPVGKFPLYFDHNIEFNLSPNNPNCFYKVTGKLVTGQKINFDRDSSTSSTLLKPIGAGKVGDQCKVTLQLKRPLS